MEIGCAEGDSVLVALKKGLEDVCLSVSVYATPLAGSGSPEVWLKHMCVHGVEFQPSLHLMVPIFCLYGSLTVLLCNNGSN